MTLPGLCRVPGLEGAPTAEEEVTDGEKAADQADIDAQLSRRRVPPAFAAAHANVGGNVYLGELVVTRGAVCFLDAQIGGTLIMQNVVLSGVDEDGFSFI